MANEGKQVPASGTSSTSAADVDQEKREGTPDDAHSEIEKMDAGHQKDLAMKREEEEEEEEELERETVRRPLYTVSLHAN